MDRNNGRYIHNRRQTNNNNQHVDNHHQHHHSHHNTSALFTMPTNVSQQSSVSREPLTQHDELIRYIREAWTNVNEHSPVVYHNDSDSLKNFKPFDLEEYWGKRHVQKLHGQHQ